MSDIQQHANNVQHLAKQYASVIKLGEMLEKLGSLENLNAEIEARTYKLRQDEAAAVAAKSTAEQAHAAAVVEHEARIASMQERIGTLKTRAVADAKKIVDDAEAKAKKVLDDANAAAGAAADAKDELEQEANELEGVIAERRGELATLDERLAALKAQARAFVG